MNVLEKAKAVIDGFDFNEEHIAKFNESAGTELSSESLKDYLTPLDFYKKLYSTVLHKGSTIP